MATANTRVIYGLHTVRHTLQKNPGQVAEVHVQAGKKRAGELETLLARLDKNSVSIVECSREELDEACGSTRHQGIVAKLRHAAQDKQPDLSGLLANTEKALLLLVLDGIQDPHNLGACLRSANAAGVDGVIVARDNAAPINATVSKVASGAAESTPIYRVTNIARTLREMQSAGVWTVGTDSEGETEIFDLDLSVSTAIVMGAEGKGLRQNTRKHCDHLVRLPMLGVVESLNVSVAAGICLYEVLRQRRP